MIGTGKPKRGKKYIIDGKEFYLYIIKSDDCYLLCDDQYFGLEANYIEFNPNELKPAPKTRSEINKVSTQQEKINRAYAVICPQFKKQHPICQARIKCSGALTTEVHHKRGRGKAYMLDTTTYLACCSDCHDWINSHNEQATALGFCQSRLSIEENNQIMKSIIITITLALVALVSCQNKQTAVISNNQKKVDSLISEVRIESKLSDQFTEISAKLSSDGMKAYKEDPRNERCILSAIILTQAAQSFNSLAKHHNDIAQKLNNKARQLTDEDIKNTHSN